MTTRSIWILAVFAVIALAPVLICGRRLAHAESKLDTAKVAFMQTSREIQEIADLRGRDEQVGLAERPARDVIAQVNAVLAQIGLPSVGLKSLLPESDSTVNSSAGQWGAGAGAGAGAGSGAGLEYRRQSLKLVLDDLSVQDIGLLLVAWQKSPSGKIWTPTRIELIHPRSGGNGKADSNRYDLSVVITATYVNTIKETP